MTAKGAAQPLTAALETALLRAIAATWDEINHNHFGRRLRRPVVALHDGEAHLGQWMGARRTLSLSRSFVFERPWGLVREVLKHEVAHQFVEEVLGVRDQPAHGPAFVEVCRRHGIDAAATGLPATFDQDAELDPLLRRIARLLALAESPNLHEAESAMKQAQRLMLKHNIDAAVATAKRGFGFRQVGIPARRVDAAQHVLASILAKHFFVEVIWVPSYSPREGREGRVLELCGTPANLEVAAWVHGYLLETGERLWREHRRAERIRGDRDRRRYLLGVMMGFDEKLTSAAATYREEGLVWTGDPALTGYLAERYPRRTGGGRFGYQQGDAYEHGRRAGRDIVLRRTVHTQTDRGRLLPPAR